MRKFRQFVRGNSGDVLIGLLFPPDHRGCFNKRHICFGRSVQRLVSIGRETAQPRIVEDDRFRVQFLDFPEKFGVQFCTQVPAVAEPLDFNGFQRPVGGGKSHMVPGTQCIAFGVSGMILQIFPECGKAGGTMAGQFGGGIVKMESVKTGDFQAVLNDFGKIFVKIPAGIVTGEVPAGESPLKAGVIRFPGGVNTGGFQRIFKFFR